MGCFLFFFFAQNQHIQAGLVSCNIQGHHSPLAYENIGSTYLNGVQCGENRMVQTLQTLILSFLVCIFEGDPS